MDGNLVGSWKLVSAVMEDVETREQKHFWGDKPNGRLIVTSGGRWLVLQTAEGRKLPLTGEDREAAFRSMIAYSGSFRTEENKIVIKIDISWDEGWIGTEQLRSFRIEGDKLYIEAPPQPYANFGGQVLRGKLMWQREEQATP